jgi:hypothetical protein
VKIEIQDDAVTTRNGTSQKNGQPFSIRSQNAWLHTAGAPYPTKMEITLDRDQAPWPVGEFTVDETSFFVDKFRRLSVGRLKLIPLAATAAKPSRVA